MPALFDMHLRARRRDRAARNGTELFLHERAFADVLERTVMMERRFGKALLIGCPDPAWPGRLKAVAEQVAMIDPGPLFAVAAGGETAIEDRIVPRANAFDLILAIGTLDTIDDLPGALRVLAASLAPGGLLIGAMSGGDTLPVLRAAMRVADQLGGAARAHVHPRIEPSALVGLLGAAGLARPVVDVDRVRVSYPSLGRLVADLRAMGATNILTERPRKPLSRAEYAAASAAFDAAGTAGKTVETFELLHFAGWAPAR
ncbi:MAG: methyltransferase domain-containing protein [Sphingomicrobium sp.]